MINCKVEIAGKRTYEFSIKSSWDELSFDELKVAQRIVFGDEATQPLDMAKLFSVITTLKPKDLKHLVNELMCDDDGVQGMIEFYEIIDFVKRERPVLYFSACAFYNSYSGPADGLMNISWEQFSKAELYYHAFMDEREEYDLDCLLSYVYWETVYTAQNAALMLKKVQKWPEEDRYAMLINYMGLRNNLLGISPVVEATASQNPEYEPTPDPIKALQASAESPGEWAVNLAVKLAGDKAGTVADINQMMAPDVISLIENLQQT